MIYDIVVKCNSTQLRMEIFFIHSEATWFRVHGLSRVTAFSIWGLTEEVRILYHLTAARVPHHTPVICYVLFHDDRLYFWNRLPDYFASAREAYKSLACRNLCAITLLLLCSDTEPAVRILGNIGALQKY